MFMRERARCVGLCVLVSGAAVGLTTQAASIGQTPQTPQSPQCSASRLVGTWERVSLLRNALSVQPPDAPLFVKFGSDGYAV
jgi:hypothetical protein